MRLFIAVNFNEFAGYFQSLQKQLPKAKQTLPKDFHLTLKFLGEVDEKKAEEIKKKLVEIKFKPFECEINGIGNFAGNSVKIVFVRIRNSEKMAELQKQIDGKLADFFKKEKGFEPHLTISRIKLVENKKRYLDSLRKIKTEKQVKKVNSFELIKSTLTPEGPVYEVLANYKLLSV